MDKTVLVERCPDYHSARIEEALESFDSLFAQNVRAGDTVALKPNWIAPWNRSNRFEWESVITNPHFITGVLKKVIRHVGKGGRIIIADAPQTDSSFQEIIRKMPVDEWHGLGRSAGVEIAVLDLRDHEWISHGEVTISRTELPGDPLGSIEFNLAGFSEFEGHRPGARGYYGADYDVEETNRAHSNGNHRYRVSRNHSGGRRIYQSPQVEDTQKSRNHVFP